MGRQGCRLALASLHHLSSAVIQAPLPNEAVHFPLLTLMTYDGFFVSSFLKGTVASLKAL